LDEVIQEKVRVLNEAKMKAVDEEDFDRAKHLKDAVDKLMMAGSQMVQLEMQKKLAIENEDFDSAKILKFEIERMRNLAFNLDTERVILAPLQQSVSSIKPSEHHRSQRQDDPQMISEHNA
jgi:centrosomal protein CEP104